MGPGRNVPCALIVRHSLVLLGLAWLVPRPVAGQESLGTIRGVVRGAQDGISLQGVSVVVRGTGLATVTASQGRYAITRVPAGVRRLLLTLLAIATLEISLANIFPIFPTGKHVRIASFAIYEIR